MPQYHGRACFLVAGVVLGLALAPDHAHGDARGATAFNAQPIIRTAYTLDARELQLGLGVQAYGITERLTITTILAGWLLPAFTDVTALNFGFRYRFMDLVRWSIAFQLGWAWVRVKNAQLIGTTRQTADAVLFPAQLFLTNRAPFRMLSTMEVTYVAGETTLEDRAVLREFNGALVSSSLQVAVNLEYPVAPRFAMTLTGRVVAWVPKGEINVGVTIDENNQLRVRGTLTQKDVQGSYNAIAGFAFYSRIFDFRIGGGYGRFIIPEVGFVYLETGPVIDFAAYFRF